MTTQYHSPQNRRKNGALSLVIVVLLAFAMAGEARATSYTFDELLSGLQEVPPTASTGTGQITGTYDDATNIFSFSLTFSGLIGPTTAAHLHSPASVGMTAPVQIGFAGFPVGVTSGIYSTSYVFTAAQETDFLAGLMYVNVHTNISPGGEIRAQLFATPVGVPEAGGTLGLLGIALAGFVGFTRWSRLASIRAS
ncbi:hypothetical protein BH18VER1_BH18VER1_02710 [soil metagenome]